MAATWSSDNPDIAEVSQDDTVTAKKPGKAVIRAVAAENGKEAARELMSILNTSIEKTI